MERRVFLAGAAAAALPGCSNLIGPPPAGQIYPVSPDLPQMGGPPVQGALAIIRPDVPGGLDSDRIALFQPDGTQDYYAGSNYPDRLPAIVQRALLEGFERAGATVSREQDAVHADLNLLTEVKDFAAHYAARDGIPDVTVAITAKLAAARGRKIVGTIMAVTHSASAGANSVGAVAQTMKQLLGRCVQDIVNDTLRQASQLLAAPPRE